MLKRLTMFTAMGILIGVPLTLAAQAQTPEVTFSGGGAGVLLCGSKPDRYQLTVAPGATVRLTNGMDGAAQLKIDGVAMATVDSGETVEVRFEQGPAKVLMVPECPLNLNTRYKPLTVHVTEPTPSATMSALPVVPSASPGPLSVGEVLIADSGDPRSPGPRGGGVSHKKPAPAISVFQGSPAIVVGAGTSTKPPAEEPLPDKRSIGLLAIIATVCVVGLSVGVARVIITQRATRPGLV